MAQSTDPVDQIDREIEKVQDVYGVAILLL